MIQINDIVITPNGENLIIDAEIIPDEDFKECYFKKIYIDTQDSYLSTGPSDDTVYEREIIPVDDPTFRQEDTWFVAPLMPPPPPIPLPKPHKPPEKPIPQQNQRYAIPPMPTIMPMCYLYKGFRKRFPHLAPPPNPLFPYPPYPEPIRDRKDMPHHPYPFMPPHPQMPPFWQDPRHLFLAVPKKDEEETDDEETEISEPTEPTTTDEETEQKGWEELGENGTDINTDTDGETETTEPEQPTILEDAKPRKIHLVIQQKDVCADLKSNFFIIYLEAEGDVPDKCEANYITTGAVFYMKSLYQAFLSWIRELNKNCEVPKNFIYIYLQYQALLVAVRTCNMMEAIKIYNKYIRHLYGHHHGSPRGGCNCGK